MQKDIFCLLILSCLAVALIAGCTSTSTGTATITSISTPTTLTTETAAVTASPTVTVTTIAQSAAIATVNTSDPILHRWVRQYPVLTGKTGWAAYEFKFYPDGTLVFNLGTPKWTSGNLEVVSSYEATGTWSKSGNNTYLLKYLPLGTTGAQIVDEYTYVPESIDKEYGRTIPEHIVSQDEIDQYVHSARELMADEMMYPERAKVD